MGCPDSVKIGDNLVFSICCHDPDTGILTDADAAPIYRIYEDETATPIATGTMAKLDDVNTTGFYTELIVCTAANGYEDGKSYTIYIEATVDADKGGISFAFKAVAKLLEGTLTTEDALRIILSSVSGKSAGGGTTTLIFRDVADGKARITAVVDSNGNRTSVIRDGT